MIPIKISVSNNKKAYTQALKFPKEYFLGLHICSLREISDEFKENVFKKTVDTFIMWKEIIQKIQNA